MAQRDCVATIRPIAINHRRLLVLGLPFALLFMPLPTRAASPVAGQVNTLTAENSGKCLDDSGASIHPGNSIIQWTCNGGAN